MLRPIGWRVALAGLALSGCAPAALPTPPLTDAPTVTPPAVSAPALTPAPGALPTHTASVTLPPADTALPAVPAPTATPTAFAFIQTFPTPDSFGFRRSDPASYRRVSGRVQLVEFFSVY